MCSHADSYYFTLSKFHRESSTFERKLSSYILNTCKQLRLPLDDWKTSDLTFASPSGQEFYQTIFEALQDTSGYTRGY